MALGFGLGLGDRGFLLGRAADGGGLRVATAGDEAAFFDGVGDHTAHERSGADGVVVTGNDVLAQVRVTVGVNHSNDRDTELVGLGDADVLFLGIEHEHRVGAAGHVADTAEVALQLLELAAEEQGFLLGHDLEFARELHPLVFLHLLNALGHGLEVGEHAAEPTLVDVRHAALLGVTLDRILSLLLGADEQDSAATGHGVAHVGVGRLDTREGLIEVDDVDAGTLAIDETLHLGVPTAGLVTEVDASVQELAHRDNSSHCSTFFCGFVERPAWHSQGMTAETGRMFGGPPGW